MHNRRFGAFLMGGWLFGTVLVWFATSQAIENVDRILSTPPPQVEKEFGDMGPDVTRQVLLFEANQLNRRITETWEMLQLGLASALLAVSILTSSRSKTMILCSLMMMALASALAFYITPSMSALAASYDFLPPGAALRERDSFHRFEVWHRVLVILNTMLALAVTTRLLFDFYEFGEKILPGFRKSKRRRRRRKMASGVSDMTGAASEAGITEAEEPNG